MLSLQARSVLGSQCHHYCSTWACSLQHAAPYWSPPRTPQGVLPCSWGSSVEKGLSPVLAAGRQSGCSVIHSPSTCIFPAAQTLLLCTCAQLAPPAGTAGCSGDIYCCPRTGLAWAGGKTERESTTLFPRTVNLGMFSEKRKLGGDSLCHHGCFRRDPEMWMRKQTVWVISSHTASQLPPLPGAVAP